MDKIVLNDERVKNNPVDEGYEESHGGCTGLETPGEGVKSRESVREARAGPESPPQHDTGIDEIVEGEKSNSCRGSVDREGVWQGLPWFVM